MAVTTGPVTRFRKSNPCPICGGGDDMPRGKGQRCSGYLSSDERFAYCTREEHAGMAALEPTDPASYRHILEGECRCGTTHNEARERTDEFLATYDYQDADGTLLYQVVRQAGKKFMQRRPDGAGGWIWNLQGITRVLYRLPNILDARALGLTVYIVEGEKDVHSVEKAGGWATCNPGGAGKWRSEYADTLKGTNIVIVADKDDPGRAHARAIAETFPADHATIVQAKTGKDVTDHLNAGHTLDELQPLELDADTTTEPSAPVVFETLRAFLKRKLPKAESLVGVVRDGTNLLPRYGWVMPWGREGSGKTSVLVDLLFHAATGRNWLGYPIARPLKIVAIINEGIPGGLQDKLEQKVECWDGDTDQVLDNLAIYASPWGEFTFKDQTIVDHARDYALGFQADYIALDPLHTLGTTGAGTPQETEEFKHLLRAFGLWQDLGIITAHHSNKNGMVSGDWARHPDTVIRLEKDGKNPATKITLEKARPADPHELGVPYLLEWIPQSMGYKRIDIDNRQKVSDDELLQAIHDELDQATRPLKMSDITDSLTGDENRIRKLVKAEIAAGNIHNASRSANRYELSVKEPGTESTESPSEYAQTRINTENHSVDPPTRNDSTQDDQPDDGEHSVRAPSPLKGARDTESTDRPPTYLDDEHEIERLRSLSRHEPDIDWTTS